VRFRRGPGYHREAAAGTPLRHRRLGIARRHVDPGESASDTAVRETVEESGVTVEITGLAGIYTDPGHVIADPRTGLVRQPFAVCFHARPLSGSPGGDQAETSDARWFTSGDIPALPIRPAMRMRIIHALTPGRTCHIG
jgi:ADP-ribose pyrophosphatase YjhB (NUDIX family)